MIKDTLQDLLNHDPFRPFRILATGGQSYDVNNPALVLPLKTEVFYAYPDSDRFALIPLRNISSVELVDQAA